jgi:hypothetical protein
MTSKEKAQELFDKFRVKVHDRDGTSAMNGFEAKQCALIAVDEMIAELAFIRNYDEEIDEKMIIKIDQRQDFLIEVEKEIEVL